MKAFWWFEENLIAGMGRPGFNATHWFDLPFDEAVLLGWFGKYSSGTYPASEWHLHLDTYCPKIVPFYNLTESQGLKAIERLKSSEGLQDAFKKLSERTQLIDDFEADSASIRFSINNSKLSEEVRFLKENGISRIVTLTENHHSADVLSQHFALHHFPVTDLTPPTFEQIQEIAQILKTCRESGETIAIHCLAGIGRTSTTLLAAHMVLGYKLTDLKNKISQRNPSYQLTGSQAEFLKSIEKRL